MTHIKNRKILSETMPTEPPTLSRLKTVRRDLKKSTDQMTHTIGNEAEATLMSSNRLRKQYRKTIKSTYGEKKYFKN